MMEGTVRVSPALPIFAINLDRAEDRWRALSATAGTLRLERVAAVDGPAVPPSEWVDVDQRRFQRSHGRRMLPGEYGCYRSHLAALDAFIATGEPLGVIVEDDIELDEKLPERVRSIAAGAPPFDVIKLVNHRAYGFRRKGTSALGDHYGRCVHGPQGSAACYAVTRDGARRLRRSLAMMWLPYDVALERGWGTGVSVLTTEKNLLSFSPLRARSSIITDSDGSYKTSKHRLVARWPTALFRARDYVQRFVYALA